MPWKPTKFPGVKIKVLYTYDSGITTALFKLEPGAVVPLHEHTALEQTYVIEGSLEDHECKAGRPNSFGAPPAISTRQSRPAGRCCSAFSSSRTVFAYCEKFFTAPGDRGSLISPPVLQSSAIRLSSAARCAGDPPFMVKFPQCKSVCGTKCEYRL